MSSIPLTQRRIIRQSAESVQALANRLGINPKTVVKWKNRADPHDLPRGRRPGEKRSLSAEEEGLIVAFRKHTGLPLDDCLYALQAHIPHLSRSTLHRCLRRHGINRLEEKAGPRLASSQRPGIAGDFHLNQAQVRSDEGPLCLFTAVEQGSKFTFVAIGQTGDRDAACRFVTALARNSPLRIKRVFTAAEPPFIAAESETSFGQTCRALGIVHRIGPSPLQGPFHTQAGRGPSPESEAAVGNEAYLDQAIKDFLHAFNFHRRLKSLGGKTPCDALCQALSGEPPSPPSALFHDLMKLEFMRI